MRKDKKLILTFTVLTLLTGIVTPGVITYFNANQRGAAATASLPQPSYGSNWLTTEVVSTESSSGSVYPSLGVGPDGSVHIAWHDHTNYGGAGLDWDVFYKRYEPGVGWTTTEVVSTESTLDSVKPSLGVGPDGSVHIAWFDATDYGGAGTDYDVFYKRYEPGVGWTTTEVVSNESTGHSQISSLDVGADGKVHIAWDDYTDYDGAGADVDVFYKRYEPGIGWTTTEVVSTESTSGSYYPSLGVGPDGSVHIAWQDYTNYDGAGGDEDVFYKMYEPGSGWTTTEVVSTESTLSSLYPSLDVETNGKVHIAWYDYTDYGSGTDIDVFYKRYEPGIGWTTTEVVSTESTSGSIRPSLGVGADGSVHISWHDQTKYGGSDEDTDVFYKRYEPGIGWTRTEVVSTESDSTSHYPWLGVGADGAVHIAWFDETDYGGAGALDDDVFYKKNVIPVVEPTDLLTLIDNSRLAHLRDLYGTEKSDAYIEIQSVEGYTEVRALLESKGYVFPNARVRISAVEGAVMQQPFSGLMYSHWSNVTSDGTAALLVAARMDDGVEFMLGVYTNILPVEYTYTGPYTIVNAMPYSFIKLCFYDTVNDRTVTWGHSWQESNTNPDWFWNVYAWWRTYTRQYYTWYYYQPWRYIWHYTYWKHWQYN